MDGENLTPELTLSMESEMHKKALLARPDIQAVVHAHPCYASAFTAMKQGINTKLLAESWFLLEEPAFAPYARMGTVTLADTVAAALQTSNIVLMENHGVLTVGKTLISAFDLIEVLENSAKMTFITETLAASKKGWETSSLSKERCDDLMQMKYGL
jgi:L-fuculose-phosphate aldolase